MPSLAFVWVLSAHAEGTFPDGPLPLVVPYPAGGVADQIARPLAQALSQRLGRPLIIDNRAGASGNIGSAWVARSQPADGYTSAPGVVNIVWNGILVHSGTPAPVVERLNKEMRTILQSPEFRKPLEAQGYEVLSSAPQEMGALITRDTPAMATVVKQAGIKID